MNKIFTIIKREYKEAVFKKSFIIMTLLTPLLMIALSVIPSLLLMMESEEAMRLHVVDQSGIVFGPLQLALDDTLKDGKSKYALMLISESSPDIQTAIDDQKLLVETETIHGLLYIPANILEELEFEFFAKNVANIDINRHLENSISKIVSDYKVQQSGLDPTLIKELTKRVNLKTIKIAKGGEESERGFLEEYFSTFIFVMILYMTLILYGTAIMRSIVQEKTTRIVEVLLSGVNPFQLMAGKILGQGSVGLTQYLIWAVFGIVLVFYGGRVMPMAGDYFNFSPEIFIYFVVFFVLGYFIYSALYAAIGALCNTDQEAQQMSFPVVMLLIVPILVFSMVVKNPNSTASLVLSLIPFFSPIIMFARINLTTPALYEILAAIGLQVITIIILIWLVAKIFRVGILMYGKRPSMPEIAKWLRYR